MGVRSRGYLAIYLKSDVAVRPVPPVLIIGRDPSKGGGVCHMYQCKEDSVEGLPHHLPYFWHYSQTRPACPLRRAGPCPYPSKGGGGCYMCKWECKDFTVEGFTLHLPYSRHMYIYIHVYIYTTCTRMRICMYVCMLYVCVNVCMYMHVHTTVYTYIFIWSAHFRVHYYVWERAGS